MADKEGGGNTAIVAIVVIFLILVVVLFLLRDDAGGSWPVFLFLFLPTLSHTLLDMLTNGGLGVALFVPFSNERYFFPWRPIEVSPVGVSSFLSDWGRVIVSGLRWVWLPSAVMYALGFVARRRG